MPQMAPFNWLSLMLYFLLILMFINILNFYMTISVKNLKPFMKFYLKFNWKW